MINKNTQKLIKNIINKQLGNPYPCSNQNVGNYIFIKDNFQLKIKKIINSHGFTIISQTKNQILLEKDNIRWIAFIMKENMRGKRAYRAIIDIEFDEKFFQNVIAPMLQGYCKEVTFFELYEN